MKKPLLCLLVFIIISNHLFAAPGNDNCINATLLTSGTTCSTIIPGTLSNATNSNVSVNSACGGSCG